MSAELSEILRLVREMHAKVMNGASVSAGAPIEAADDAELDGQWGDEPLIEKDPKRWTGRPLAPIKMSAAPVEYLRVVAAFWIWQGRQDDKNGKKWRDRPASGFKYKAAARALGWIRRKESTKALADEQHEDASSKAAPQQQEELDGFDTAF